MNPDVPRTLSHVTELFDIPLTTISGEATTLKAFGDGPMLIVNVASKCGFTPQYEGLEALYREYRDRGLTVLGFPCNQFLAQEPGTDAQIAEYCSINWGVTFPMFAKVKVNGRGAHPLYLALKKAKDDAGRAGLVLWNFEKFLVLPSGKIRRFRSSVEPQAPELVAAIEGGLAK